MCIYVCVYVCVWVYGWYTEVVFLAVVFPNSTNLALVKPNNSVLRKGFHLVICPKNYPEFDFHKTLLLGIATGTG